MAGSREVEIGKCPQGQPASPTIEAEHAGKLMDNEQRLLLFFEYWSARKVDTELALHSQLQADCVTIERLASQKGLPPDNQSPLSADCDVGPAETLARASRVLIRAFSYKRSQQVLRR